MSGGEQKHQEDHHATGCGQPGPQPGGQLPGRQRIGGQDERSDSVILREDGKDESKA